MFWFIFTAGKMGVIKRLSLLLLVGLIACLDDPACFELNNNLAGISFKNFEDGSTLSQTFVSVTADGTDYDFATNATASTFVLPLNQFADQTTFNFQTADASFQLTLAYETQVQFVSKDCGEKFVLSNLEIIEHTFDSVRLVSATPGFKETSRNVEVYLK